jgi:hypothetical protein
MNSFYLFLVALLVSFTSNAQIIDIPDANFKNALISEGVDTNNDGEISVSEAEATTGLSISGLSISSLEGIENFANITTLNVSDNQISTFDSNWLPNLVSLFISSNLLTNLDLSNSLNLSNLQCNNNSQLTTINLENITQLSVIDCNDNALLTILDISASTTYELYCTNNPNLTSLGLSSSLDFLTLSNIGVSEIDVSEMTYMTQFWCANNPNLTFVQLGGDNSDDSNFNIENNPVLQSISLKNGLSNYDGFEYGNYSICNNPSLIFVCADEYEIDGFTYTINEGGNIITIEVDGAQQMVNNCGYTNVVVSSYCSFEPGGDYYTIEGNTKIDIDDNGCDTNDDVYPHMNFSITNGSQTGSIISGNSGDYSIPVTNGSHTIAPVLENTDYFTVSPTEITVSFPTDTSPYIQDFCIIPNGTFNDLEITIIPLEAARPGFDSDYKIVYKNKGTTTLSGDIDFGFQDEVMEFISSTPANESGLTDLLSYSFTDLSPFESREITLTMNLNAPTDANPLNGGDVLSFITSINASETDETPDDNTFELHQTVVNSFDPNDKTCLEGAFITPEMVGDFVHYMIRFENTGTANAINIVVKDHIDRTKYDLSSLVALNASHDFVARIKDDASDYYVEFIFENINLPFDDANNDGYVVFKIKTLDTLALNDTFENEAEIYFDFNFPIITNLEQTTVATLSTEDFELANNAIKLYPNPASDILQLDSKQAIKQITIYDISGRNIQEIAVIGNKTEMTIFTEDFSAGTYFVKIKTEVSELVKSFIKD